MKSRVAGVDRELLAYQQLGVSASFGGANLDHQALHKGKRTTLTGSSFRERSFVPSGNVVRRLAYLSAMKRVGAKSAVALELAPPSVEIDGKRPNFFTDFAFVKGKPKGEDIEKGTLELRGYGSTWVKDRDEEWIDPAAYDSSLKYFLEKNPMLLYMHDMEKPIGKVREAFTDEFGLNVIAWVPPPTDKQPDWAHHAYQMINKGILKTFSVGGLFTRDFVMGREVIKEIELLELSVVSIPSNPESIFEAAQKALKGVSSRPMLTPAHVRQMKQLIGLEELTLPDLAVMTPEERIQRYEQIAAYYRKTGVRPPSIDAWSKLKPRLMDAKGRAVVGPASELAHLMRLAQGGTALGALENEVEGKRGRVLSKKNEDQLRAVLSSLDDAEEILEKIFGESKKRIRSVKSDLDIVLKQVDEDSKEESSETTDEEDEENGAEQQSGDGVSDAVAEAARQSEEGSSDAS